MVKINFLKHKAIFFAISTVFILGAIILLLVFGLRPGIDFTGGTIMEIGFEGKTPSNQEVRKSLEDLNLGEIYIQPAGENGLILRLKDITEKTHQEILSGLRENYQVKEKRFESIGPVVGKELREKTLLFVVLALLAILIYIAFSFRKIKRPLTSWFYGFTSILALCHDVLIPLGAFAVLGKFLGVQITIPIVVALLTVVGYSINNTVVVFDRVRENLLKGRGESFEETVNISLNQTLARCINTSLTTLFPLIMIFLLGGESLRYFSLALILGIVAGTYSSLFLAGPLLVGWYKLLLKKRP